MKIIKHTKMASAARRQIIGGGAPIIKSRWRRPQVDGGAAGAGLYMYICMYVCACTYVLCIRMHVCVYVVCIRICMYVSLHVRVFLCMNACTCMHASVYVCMYVFMYVCMYVCMCACLRACMNVFIHACMYVHYIRHMNFTTGCYSFKDSYQCRVW